MAGYGRYVSGYTLRKRWDAVRAGWPTLLVPALGSILVANTGQGKEALYAMTQSPHNWLALFAFIFCGLVLYARFIAATNHHYPFSVNAIHSNRPVPHIALLAACGMPFVFLLLYLRQQLVQLVRGGDVPYWSGLAVCVCAILIIVAVHRVAGVKLTHVIQTHSSRFLVFNYAWRRTEHVLVTLLFVLALLVWGLPSFATFVGPVPVFAVGMTVWAVVGNLLVSIIARRDWMPSPVLAVLVFVAAIALLVPLFGRGHYMVATVDRVRCLHCSASRPLATAAAQRWFAERATGGGPVTAIVVTADGGGIRAALETATILAQLDANSRGEFYRHVYAMSGVSGGAIGLATYVAAHAFYRNDADNREVEAVQHMLKADHFSPMLAGLLLRDVPDMLVPFSVFQSQYIPDRARLFERSLSEDWVGAREMRKGIEQAMVDTVPAGHTPPLLLLNTTLSNAGTIETVSNVGFSKASDSEILCNVLDRLNPAQTLSLVTAAHLSARFPIVDSPGELTVSKEATAPHDCKQAEGVRLDYVDGGYADNTGAAAALYAVDALQAAKKTGRFQNTLRILVIHIYASASNPQDSATIRSAGEDVRALDDLQVPIQAVGSVRYELGLGPLKTLCERVGRVNAASPDDELHSIGDCAQIGARQSPQEASDSSVLTKLYDGSSCLLWLNAALYVSDRQNDPDYVPLGWMLGPSAPYVAEQSKRIANGIGTFLAKSAWTNHAAMGNAPGCR